MQAGSERAVGGPGGGLASQTLRETHSLERGDTNTGLTEQLPLVSDDAAATVRGATATVTWFQILEGGRGGGTLLSVQSVFTSCCNETLPVRTLDDHQMEP